MSTQQKQSNSPQYPHARGPRWSDRQLSAALGILAAVLMSVVMLGGSALLYAAMSPVEPPPGFFDDVSAGLSVQAFAIPGDAIGTVLRLEEAAGTDGWTALAKRLGYESADAMLEAVGAATEQGEPR